MVASSSRRSPWVGRASPRDETRCGGGGVVVATGSVARRLLGILIVGEDASGAFSRARVAASHTQAEREAEQWCSSREGSSA